MATKGGGVFDVIVADVMVALWLLMCVIGCISTAVEPFSDDVAGNSVDRSSAALVGSVWPCGALDCLTVGIVGVVSGSPAVDALASSAVLDTPK